MAVIRVAGWQKVSLIDYPGLVAAVLFLGGCNLRCHYCHNPELWRRTANRKKFSTFFRYLQAQQTRLDAVVISGGEPTLDPQLPDICRQIKALGLKVKVDTNGTRPTVIRHLVASGLIDFVALDVKAPLAQYPEIAGGDGTGVAQTAAFLRQQNRVGYVFRTTLSPRLTEKDLVLIGQTLVRGAPQWHWQQCRVPGAYPAEKVEKMAVICRQYTQDIVVRGL